MPPTVAKNMQNFLYFKMYEWLQKSISTLDFFIWKNSVIDFNQYKLIYKLFTGFVYKDSMYIYIILL